MNPNAWLTDPVAIQAKLPHCTDVHYAVELCSVLSAYLYRCPVRVRVVAQDKSSQLLFKVKQNEASFNIDPEIAPHDFIFSVEKEWLASFFPSYKVVIQDTASCSEQEMTALLESHSVDELLEKQQLGYKTVTIEKRGVITKIALLDDRFKIVTQDGTYWRIAKFPLSQFMDQLRSIVDEWEKMTFIEQHSKLLNAVRKNSHRTYNLNHTPAQLLSFLLIRKESLQKEPFVALPGPRWFQWGPFVFQFVSQTHMEQGRQIIGEQIWQKHNKQVNVE